MKVIIYLFMVVIFNLGDVFSGEKFQKQWDGEWKVEWTFGDTVQVFNKDTLLHEFVIISEGHQIGNKIFMQLIRHGIMEGYNTIFYKELKTAKGEK